MPGLPKWIIAKYGISKKAWSVYRGTKGGKTSLAKKKTRRSYGSRIKRRVSSAKIPLEVAIAGVTMPWTPAQDGWSTPASCAMSKDWEGIARSMKTGFLGMKDGDHFDPIGLINPFDFNCGRYLKMLIVGGVAHKIRTKFVRIPMKKIPLVGRYLS